MGRSGTTIRLSAWRLLLFAILMIWVVSPALAQNSSDNAPRPFVLAATDNIPEDAKRPILNRAAKDVSDAADLKPVSGNDALLNETLGRRDENEIESAVDGLETTCAEARKQASKLGAQQFPLSAPLVLGGRYVGDIDLRVDMEGNGDLDAPRLEALMKPILDAAAMDQLRDIRGDSNYVPIAKYCDQPIRVLFDSGALELRAEPVVSALENQAISLRTRTPPNPDDFMEPEKFSAGIGVLVSQTYSFEGQEETGFNPLRANFEGYINFNDWIDGTLFFAADALEGDDDAFRRREVQFVHDNFDKATRLAIGDINPPIRAFQTSRPLGGISFSRQYNAIQPFRRTISTGRGQISLERDSTVEVYVNGVLSERLDLRAGNYTLEDFPAAQGVNDVQLRIEDDLGRFIERDFSFFSNSQLLAEGLLDFGVSMGVPRSPSDTGFDYGDELIASGFVNYGLSDTLTLGLNAQARSNRLQLGSEAVFGSRLGTFGVEASASYFDDVPSITTSDYHEFGQAVGLTHRANFKLGENPVTFNSSAIYQSEFFAGIGASEPSNQKFVFRTNATASLPNQYRLGVTASMITDHTGQGNSQRISLTGSKSFERFSVNLSANYQSRTFGDDETSLLASISVPFGQRSRIRANVNTNNSLKALEFARSGRGQVGRLDARGQAIDSDLEQSLNANMNYWHNRFESRIELDTVHGRGPDGIDQSDISYRFGTFVGYSGGKFGVGRPSPAGFILIDRHKSLRTNPLKVHDSNGKDIEAQSGLFGAALVPIRRPYMPMRLALDVEGVAPGYDLGTGRLDVLPRWGAGYRVQIGSDASRMVLGMMRAEDGSPIKLLLGEFQRIDRKDEEVHDFFTNAAGKFVIEGVAPGRYLLRFADGRSVEIEIGEDTEGLVNVGELEVS